MKLSEAFITYNTENESILVPLGDTPFSGMVKGNKTLGAILALLKEETTEQEVIHAMQRRFNVPEDIIIRDVKKALAELRKIGALEE